jgi:hypothetical protein
MRRDAAVGRILMDLVSVEAKANDAVFEGMVLERM